MWFWILSGVLFAFGLGWWFGLPAKFRNWRKLRERALFEDALKHLLAFEHRGQQGTLESLAGRLGLSQKRLVELIAHMEARGVLHSVGGGLHLSPDGKRWALQVVRAHRLWERYLADEAGVPMEQLHGAAERAEHHLSPERLDALEAQLGHPAHDPHGDPIPGADASLALLVGVPLTDWPLGETAQIVHVEDEPEVILKQILTTGLRPGSIVRVLESGPKGLILSDGEQEHRLAPVLAANIQVADAPKAPERPAGLVRLADLKEGEEAEVVAIDAQYRGYGRRRLLDLGLTPQARVQPELTNAFGDPRAFRVRGSLIVLRKEQAAQVWVRPGSRPSQGGPQAGALTA